MSGPDTPSFLARLFLAAAAFIAGSAAMLASAAAADGGGSAAPSQLAAPPLSSAQLADIGKFIDQHGRKAVIDPDLSKNMALSKGDNPVTVDQVSLRDKDEPNNRHILDRLTDGSGFLVVRETGTVRALYHIGSDLKIVKGIIVRAGKRNALTAAEAAQGLRQELVTWAAVAGRHN